jgi:hypothetical protein
MKVRIFWIALIFCIVFPFCASSFQQTEVVIDCSIKAIQGEATPTLLNAAEITIQYPTSMVFEAVDEADNQFHISKTLIAFDEDKITRQIKLGLINAYGWKSGSLLRIRFSRIKPIKYSTVTGQPLGEPFKVVEYKLYDTEGVLLDSSQGNVTLKKYNWQHNNPE